KFITSLLLTLCLFRGKATFRNLSRYSDYCEKTYSRQYRKSFDFTQFNLNILERELPKKAHLIAAMDCHFTEKSGQKSYGLSWFYNGKTGRAERGLEFSELAIIDVNYNTAYHLSSKQTPDQLEDDQTRMDVYLQHLSRDKHNLPTSIRYIVLDGYYAKNKFINGVLGENLHALSKLRHDAHLRWLYTGEQKPLGRHKQYDGKVIFDEHQERFEQQALDPDTQIYTAIVNSPSLKLDIRVVFLVHKGKRKAILVSTDTQLEATEIVRYYRSRFQIEFLFRDARQYTGLGDCQSPKKEALTFHFNASMTALNLLKLQDREGAEKRDDHVISIQRLKIRKFNKYLIDRIISLYLG
ncbi:MAG TPA: IS4 family transposase, partial [Thiothrix sp.]|nr:IS4 family transposase [Thiothrix sp.]